MHTTIRMSLKRASAAALLVAMMTTAAPAADSDEAAVLAANAGFYSALNILFTGDAAPMMDVWSHADDVTYMGPTGTYDRGWDAIRQNWEGQAKLKLGGKVEPAEVNVVVGSDMAFISEYEEGENTNADGKVAKLKLRGSNTFRKEDGVWKLIGHHTDPLPYLDR
mgnify:CR=1 FL=1